jgi:hypothetical protein
MTMTAPRPPVSETTQRANAFVAEHTPAAEALGDRLAEVFHDPDALTEALRGGLERLADPAYLAGQQLVAPGIGPTLGVRNPLLDATLRRLRAATKGESSTVILYAADRLLREEVLELRWVAFRLLEWTVERDPERTWQLIRRAAHHAADWISVDTLARPAARGILAERYRWAELEQLVYAPSRWERRFVGSTIASIPFVDRDAGRTQDYVRRALPLLGDLIGDDQPDVQKALSWAYRSVAQVDGTAVADALEAEAATATATEDGHRAWVIRDVLPKLEGSRANALRERLDGVRRRPGAPSTSRAAETAARFRDLGLGRPMPEPPL